jgi:histidine phosphotransferase ChpT
MNESLIITQLLSTKLCHDIAGLVGAINNAIDYQDNQDESIRAQATSLLETSAKEAVKRLNFYREAYGTIRNEAVNISLVKTLLDNFVNPDKFSITLENSSQNQDISQLTLKFCLTIVSVAYIMLARGGTILLKFISENNSTISLNEMLLSGKMIIKKEEIFDILRGGQTKITANNINAYYAYLLSKELNKTIEIDIFSDKLIYKFI